MHFFHILFIYLGPFLYCRPDSCILLDCGEGTSAQLKRFYGIEKSNEIFNKLKAVYISHLHADHHIGKKFWI